MDILIPLAAAMLGAFLNQVFVWRREHLTRRNALHALERDSVSRFTESISDVQHNIQLLQVVGPAFAPPEQLLQQYRQIHNARMKLMAAYSRTRLDVTTPEVRSSIDNIFYLTKELDVIIDSGSHGVPPQETIRDLLFLNNHISQAQEKVISICERTISPRQPVRWPSILPRRPKRG